MKFKSSPWKHVTIRRQGIKARKHSFLKKQHSCCQKKLYFAKGLEIMLQQVICVVNGESLEKNIQLALIFHLFSHGHFMMWNTWQCIVCLCNQMFIIIPSIIGSMGQVQRKANHVYEQVLKTSQSIVVETFFVSSKCKWNYYYS